nr:hypothetical protein [Tanacetum cinerariifolium]
MDQRMNEAVKVAIQILSDRLRDEAQADNEEFLKNLDENIQKIIKEQVKDKVKATSPSIKLIRKGYESDKIILDTYGDTITLKRRRDDDADKDEELFARSDRGSKRRRDGKEPKSARAPKEKATRSSGKFTQGSKSRQTSASESATAEEPMRTTHEMEEPSHPEFEIGADDQSIAKPSHHPKWESARDVYSKRRIIAITELKIVELHNCTWIGSCNGMLTDVRTTLDDRLKRIQMKYLPQTIWRKSDKERATTVILAIDKQLKTRMITRSLERFIGGRLYEGDCRML